MENRVLLAVVGSMLALGLSTAQAEGMGNGSAAKGNMEKCFGIAKAGHNDCSSIKALIPVLDRRLAMEIRWILSRFQKGPATKFLVEL